MYAIAIPRIRCLNSCQFIVSPLVYPTMDCKLENDYIHIAMIHCQLIQVLKAIGRKASIVQLVVLIIVE